MLGDTRKLIISALAIGLGLNSAAFATADQPSLAGVWDGTIGNLPVRVCFDWPESSKPGMVEL